MKNPNPQDGYAPDLFSEHARAAQLGLRVRDILRNPPMRVGTEKRYLFVPDAYDAIKAAALELGLLDTQPTPPKFLIQWEGNGKAKRLRVTTHSGELVGYYGSEDEAIGHVTYRYGIAATERMVQP